MDIQRVSAGRGAAWINQSIGLLKSGGKAIWLPALVVIAACSFFVAPLGAKLAHKLPVSKLKRVFASVLYLLAAYMLYKGLIA